jgi:hypothetical protein
MVDHGESSYSRHWVLWICDADFLLQTGNARPGDRLEAVAQKVEVIAKRDDTARVWRE